MAATEETRKTKRAKELYNKGLYSLESGQYDYAVTLFRSSLSIEPWFEKAQEGIKLAKTRKLQQSSLPMQKIKSIVLMLQALFCENIKKYDRALDKYESLFALIKPPPQMLGHLGDMYKENDIIPSAIIAYKAVLHTDANNVCILSKLGQIYLNNKNMKEAKSIYDNLSSIETDDADIHREIKNAYATITIDEGKWEEEVSFRKKTVEQKPHQQDKETASPSDKTKPSAENIRILKNKIANEPQNPELHKQLAKLLTGEEVFDDAISEYKKALELSPDDADTRKTLAGLYEKKGSMKNAVRQYQEMHRRFPDQIDIIRKLAELYQHQDAPDNAIAAYKEIIKLKPDDTDVHETLGNLYEHTRYFDEAIEEYEKAVAISPERTTLEEKLGNLYIRNGMNQKAIEKFEKAIRNDKANTSARKLLGNLYLKAKQIWKAKQVMQEILEISPGERSVKARLKEVEALELETTLDDIDSRIQNYEKQVSAEPDNTKAREELSKAKTEKLDLLTRSLENQVAVDPQNTKLHYELGAVYHKSGQIDKALKELQRSANNEKTAVKSLHLIGLCFENKNMFDIAVKQLEKAADKLSEMNEIKKAVFYDLGRIYEKMGFPQKAVDRYKEIYENDIDYKDISAKIEQAYRK